MQTQRKDFFVALSNIRSLYNVGAVFRTADAFGVTKVILGGYTGCPPRKEISKTALGAERWIPWEKRFRLSKALQEYRKKGFSIIGLENNIPGTMPLKAYKPLFPLILVLGNEVRGLSVSVKREIQTFISIPMQGKKESLNVSVAFGIAAYHIVTQGLKVKG